MPRLEGGSGTHATNRGPPNDRLPHVPPFPTRRAHAVSSLLPPKSHDLDYPDFYDSLYRLVTPEMMYAKYRARFFRMVDLCLSSSHVPAYVVAAFLKRLAR